MTGIIDMVVTVLICGTARFTVPVDSLHATGPMCDQIRAQELRAILDEMDLIIKAEQVLVLKRRNRQLKRELFKLKQRLS